MTTTELENKLKISKNTCIHCPIEELAKQVLNIFHHLGLKWCNEKHYIICTNWDKHEENTLYYPFDGLYSSLKFADLTGYKVISAEEFITLHTEEEEFDLENYEPEGNLKGFPKEIISHMLAYQEKQGNPRDISVFERNKYTIVELGGFDWDKTIEENIFWEELIGNKNFNLVFKKYTKQDYQNNPQEFKVGDEVYDILQKEVGVVQYIDYSPYIPYGLSVKFKSGLKSYTINGCYIPEYKNPHLLHYRDDYDYSIINFNNLPKRQKPKRWRAEKGGKYYSLTSNFKVEDYIEDNDCFDNEAYDSGNYFQTKEEAQEVKDKLNKYFQELINPNK